MTATLFDHAGGGPAIWPEDAEFRSALRAYMEWAVGEFSAHPETADTVPPVAGLPRWGWAGLVSG